MNIKHFSYVPLTASSFVVMFVYIASICIASLLSKILLELCTLFMKNFLEAMNFEYLNPQNIFKSESTAIMGVSHVLFLFKQN